MNEFKNAEEALKALRKAEAEEARERARKCDWENPLDVSAYRHERHSIERRKLLDMLVPDRKCPTCEKVIVKTRSWVVNVDENMAICRSCYFRMRNVEPTDKVKVESKFYKEITRYEINASEIIRLRKFAKISQGEFARVAGWTRSRQRQLEDGNVRSVDKDTLETVIETFEKFGIEIINHPSEENL